MQHLLYEGENPYCEGHIHYFLWEVEKCLGSRSEISSVFPVMLGDNCSALELLSTCWFAKIDDEAKSFVLSADFPMERSGLQVVYMVLLSFGTGRPGVTYSPSKDEVLKEAEYWGLERPSPEDALRFAKRYASFMGTGKDVFVLHEPWIVLPEYRMDPRRSYIFVIHHRSSLQAANPPKWKNYNPNVSFLFRCSRTFLTRASIA